MGDYMKQYLTIIKAEELAQSNIEARLRTSNYHDLFYSGMTTNGETITHYVSHHPFNEQEAKNMAAYFENFYDMTETTKEAEFAKLGLGLLPYENKLENNG
jgi:hypothetical protein